jgi:hypothetical protein
MKITFILATIIFTFFSTSYAFAWSLFGPKSYEDCVINNMKGVSSDDAARAIRNACRKKFPPVEKKVLILPESELPRIESSIEDFRYPITSKSGKSTGSIEYLYKTNGYAIKVYNGTDKYTISEIMLELDIEGKGIRQFVAKADSQPFERGLSPHSSGVFRVNPQDLIVSSEHRIVGAKGFSD